ncbi:putative ankyrin repeat protein [Tupanvirus deep ocean]|uniref:Ankyrin repeat protein n=2 Tax=Tupanvirus TaxID=2094720 RepID=A0AC62A9N9_9VIRU|nr:putative ankyrin repeat protein [Tupanvirus deep ocean]QKU34495.1 putative ankyrin repeat protein [Tupanvirus deep ocean]
MDTLYHDVMGLIFGYLPLKNIIELELVCKKFRKFIRSHLWNMKVRLYKIKNIEHVVNNYNFLHYDFSYSLIDDSIVEKLGYCRTLNLSWCVFITNNSLKYLNKCESVVLNYCPKINNCLQLSPQNITEDYLKLLVDFYVKAIYHNNIEIIKCIQKNIDTNNIKKEKFISQLFAANAIKIAFRRSNIRIIKHVERYINYLGNCDTPIFIYFGRTTNINNPIIDAAEHGDLVIFKYLHSVGYNIHFNKNRPFEIAIENNHFDIVKYIMDADDTHKNMDFRFIHLSIKNGHDRITKLLSTKPTYGIKLSPTMVTGYKNKNFWMGFNVVP